LLATKVPLDILKNIEKNAGLAPCLSRVRMSATPELTPLTEVHEEVMANFVARLRRQVSRPIQDNAAPGHGGDCACEIGPRESIASGRSVSRLVRPEGG